MNKVERIRRRQSYKMFTDWLAFSEQTAASRKDILERLFAELDGNAVSTASGMRTSPTKVWGR